MIYKQSEIKAAGSMVKARLDLYLWSPARELGEDIRRPMVLICPGGAYLMTSEREGEPIAFSYISKGFNAAVLWYSVSPARYPEALRQLALSVRYIRENAEEFKVDPDRIIISGFSAGAHLAGCLGMLWSSDFLCNDLKVEKDEIKPNGMILGYPVVSSSFRHARSFRELLGDEYDEKLESLSLEKLVSEDTPKTFLWHTWNDNTVPVENTLLLAAALRKHNIETELHIYPRGIHGLALANKLTMCPDGRANEPYCQGWMDLSCQWIENLK
jgi:acetyl esterase/lipase